jgi:hypothetical protein
MRLRRVGFMNMTKRIEYKPNRSLPFVVLYSVKEACKSCTFEIMFVIFLLDALTKRANLHNIKNSFARLN